MKPYKGLIQHIRCDKSRHNHLIITGTADNHPIYTGCSMHTSGVEKVEFYQDKHAEIETHNSRYNIIDEDYNYLQQILMTDEFDDLVIENKEA